jgi:flagellin
MSIVIQSNIASLQAQKNLSMTQSALSATFDKLSSGYRINTAADDAAGLAISESMKMQIRSFSVAERNANDAISMAQTAEGALGEVSDVLGRMRELAMQGSNGSLQTSDRGFLNTEFGQLKAEIQRIQQSTTFNNQKLLATGASSITFQVGINTGSSW